MRYVITEATFANPALRQAFMDYFAELGVTVRNWEPLFQELDRREGWTLLRQNDAGHIAGFLLCSVQQMSSGFFTASIGFVEEMYVAPAYRHQRHGAALMSAAEERFCASKCGYAILTTDSAPGFFTRQGYLIQPSITAKNGDPVYVKPLEKPLKP